MKRITSILIVLTLVLTFGLGTAFAEGQGEGQSEEEKGTVELGYMPWIGERAATNVAAVVLDEMGYDVQLTEADAGVVWSGVGTGDIDAHLAGWMPNLHAQYLEENEDGLEEIGTALDATTEGLAVPTYVDDDIQTIGDLEEHADKFGNEIVGIDPGAGIMSTTEDVIEDYGLSLRLVESSGPAMASALLDAASDEEPIVVTAWQPHPMWGQVDLRYLEDPNGHFTEGYVGTFARNGLEEDMPEVHEFLSNFNWSASDISNLLVNMSEGNDDYEAAQEWVENNRDLVASWMP